MWTDVDRDWPLVVSMAKRQWQRPSSYDHPPTTTPAEVLMAYQTRSSRTETLLLEELRARQGLHVERIEGTHHPEYRVGVSEWMDEWGGGLDGKIDRKPGRCSGFLVSELVGPNEGGRMVAPCASKAIDSFRSQTGPRRDPHLSHPPATCRSTTPRARSVGMGRHGGGRGRRCRRREREREKKRRQGARVSGRK